MPTLPVGAPVDEKVAVAPLPLIVPAAAE